MKTTSYVTDTLSQRSDSTKMTNSDESLHISSIARLIPLHTHSIEMTTAMKMDLLIQQAQAHTVRHIQGVWQIRIGLSL